MYGRETWSPLREEHILRVFQDKVLKGIFRPKRNKVMEVRRRFYNAKLHKFYSSQDIIMQIKSRRMGWMGIVVSIKEGRKENKLWVGKPE
jgi:hypothetical protein